MLQRLPFLVKYKPRLYYEIDMIVEKNRHLIILKNLLDEENVTSEKLALLSFSSVRTIKSDLLYLKEILEKEKIVRIVAAKSKGYHLEVIDEEKYSQFRDEIYRLSSLFSGRSIENMNREFYILKYLFCKKNALVDDLCENLHLSRNAITEDLRKAETYLASYDIKVESLPGKGLFLTGDEWKLRLAMIEAHCSQYHEFSPIYPLKDFDELFYTDKREYEDLRHGFLKILRESLISLSDISTKKIATYLCLIKNGGRESGNEKRSIFPYEKMLAEKIFDELLPERKNEYEVVALADLLSLFNDHDLRNQKKENIYPAYLLSETSQALDEIVAASQKILYNPLLDTASFAKMRTEFEDIIMSIIIRRLLGCSNMQHLADYNEKSEEYTGPLVLQFTRVFVSAIEEKFGLMLSSDTIIPIRQLFHYLLEDIAYPYEKRNIAVVSLDAKAVAQAMRRNILDRYGSLIERADVFNQYEMRRIDFTDYDAVLISHGLSVVYNRYPIPFIEYHSPMLLDQARQLFMDLFIKGFDYNACKKLTEISHFHLSTSIENYESFLQALLFRYGSDEGKTQVLEDQMYRDERIVEHVYTSSGISVIFFDPKDVDHSFVDFYVPKRMIVNDKGQRIRGFIALSFHTDLPVGELKLLEGVLCLLASDVSYIEGMSSGTDKVIEDAFSEACFRIFPSIK